MAEAFSADYHNTISRAENLQKKFVDLFPDRFNQEELACIYEAHKAQTVAEKTRILAHKFSTQEQRRAILGYGVAGNGAGSSMDPKLTEFIAKRKKDEPWEALNIEKALAEGKEKLFEQARLVERYMEDTATPDEWEMGGAIIRQAMNSNVLTEFMHFLSITSLTILHKVSEDNIQLHVILTALLQKKQRAKAKHLRGDSLFRSAKPVEPWRKHKKEIISFVKDRLSADNERIGWPVHDLKDQELIENIAARIGEKMDEDGESIDNLKNHHLFCNGRNGMALDTEVNPELVLASLSEVEDKIRREIEAMPRFAENLDELQGQYLVDELVQALVDRAILKNTDRSYVTQKGLPGLRVEVVEVLGKEVIRLVFDTSEHIPRAVREKQEMRENLNRGNIKFINRRSPEVQLEILEDFQNTYNLDIEMLDELKNIDTSTLFLNPELVTKDNYMVVMVNAGLELGEPIPPGLVAFYEGSHNRLAKNQRKDRGKGRVNKLGNPFASVEKNFQGIFLGNAQKGVGKRLSDKIKMIQKEEKALKREAKLAKAKKKKKKKAAEAAQAEEEAAEQARLAQERSLANQEAKKAEQRRLYLEFRKKNQEEKKKQEKLLREKEQERERATAARRQMREQEEKVLEGRRLAELEEIQAALPKNLPPPLQEALTRTFKILRIAKKVKLESNRQLTGLQQAYEVITAPEHLVLIDYDIVNYIEERLLSEMGRYAFGKFKKELAQRRQELAREQADREMENERREERKRQEVLARAEEEAIRNRTPGTLWSRELRRLRQLTPQERIERLKESVFVGPPAGLDNLLFHLRGQASPWEEQHGFGGPTTLISSFVELETLEWAHFYKIHMLMNKVSIRYKSPDFTLLVEHTDTKRQKRVMELKNMHFTNWFEFGLDITKKMEDANEQIEAGLQDLHFSMDRRRQDNLGDGIGGIIRLNIEAGADGIPDWQRAYDEVVGVIRELDDVGKLDATDGVMVFISHYYDRLARQTPILTYYREEFTGRWLPSHPFMDRLTNHLGVNREIRAVYEEPLDM